MPLIPSTCVDCGVTYPSGSARYGVGILSANPGDHLMRCWRCIDGKAGEPLNPDIRRMWERDGIIETAPNEEDES